MPETDENAGDVIDSYRRRRNRLVPLIVGGVAIVLLVVGLFMVVLWLTGESPPAMPGFRYSRKNSTGGQMSKPGGTHETRRRSLVPV